jgi:hypothetical protein
MITLDTLFQNPELRKGAGWRGAVTHCREGHPYTRENTIITHCGSRTCRTCWNARELARQRARRAARNVSQC